MGIVVTVLDAVRVAVLVGINVLVGIAVRVFDGTLDGVPVGSWVFVEVAVGGTKVFVGTGVWVQVAVGATDVSVGVGVFVGTPLGKVVHVGVGGVSLNVVAAATLE